MSFPLSIVIWDYDPERIAEIDRNLHQALRELNFRGTVSSLSNRRSCPAKRLVGREPVLEIGDAYWSYGREKPSPKKPASSCFHESSRKG
ncbi:MAG: hypothetical protein ACLRWP_13130 [Bilophila wadsworthia]